MSYTTKVTGGFEIEPPLTWDEIKASQFTHAYQAGPGSVAVWRAPGTDLDLIVDMTEQDIEGGVAYRYSGTKLVMRQIDEYRADGLEQQVQRVVGMFGDHTYEGSLDAEGEGGGWGPDVWRIRIRNGRAIKETAIMLYPDDLMSERHEYAAGTLRAIADEAEGLPQDHELDPGRGDVVLLLRTRADEYAAGNAPAVV